MVINGNAAERTPITIGGITITNCHTYVYLGSPFTQDGKVTSAIKAHCDAKASHIIKFAAFVKKNQDFPFWIKKKVLDSALLSAILYGCESWMCHNLGQISPLYMGAIKILLGVRKTTTNDLCLLELGYPSPKAMIQNIQQRCLRNLISKQGQTADDPFNLIWTLVADARTPTARYVLQLMHEDNITTTDITMLKGKVRNRDSTKCNTYCKVINPSLEVHPIYTNTTSEVSEYQRLSFTRLRLSAHTLAVETGRWCRKPRETVCVSVGRSRQNLTFV